MVYKSINDLAPTYLTEMFLRLSDASKRELRNTRSDLEIPVQRSANSHKCFSYKGATELSQPRIKIVSDIENFQIKHTKPCI